MRFDHKKLIGLAAVAAILGASPLAAQGKGHGKGNKDHKNDGRVVVIDNGTVVSNGNRVPPGLAKKPGQMPPGQYKKRYTTYQGAGVLRDILTSRGYTVVRMAPSNTSQIVYYRTSDGVLRRGIVTQGSSQLGFSNLPAAIVSEVLARLY